MEKKYINDDYHETLEEVKTEPNSDNACFAFRKLSINRYVNKKNKNHECFSFTWIDGNKLKPARQIEIPNERVLFELLIKAASEGWFNFSPLTQKLCQQIASDKIYLNPEDNKEKNEDK